MNTIGARIDCSAHGNPQPQQRWMTSDGHGVYPVPGLIKLASNGSLVLLPFSSDTYRQNLHAASYVCYATNIYGTIRSVSVNVRAVMEQIYQGQVYDEYVIRKNTAVFKCQLPSFVRDDVIVTNWMVNGDVIHFQDLKYVMFPSGKLHILNVDESDDLKQFRCETRHRLNGAVHISSEYGTLHVTESRSSIQPQKGHHEQVIYAQEGSDICLPCAAQSFPPPVYTWLREDERKIVRPLREWKKFSLRGGSLMLTDIKKEDSGFYECFINNTLGYLTLKTKLIVSAPLRVYIHNQRQIVDFGKMADLTCTVAGYPVDKVKWRLNGEDIQENARIKQHGHILSIKQVKRHDSGMYQCFVSNALQTIQATAQLLLGDVTPEIVDTFKSLTLQPGPTVSLKCIAAGTPLPRIKWLLDDVPLKSNQRRKMSSYIGAGGQTISFLNISGVNVQDGGEYSCVAKNSIGQDSYADRINVFGIPHVREMVNITVASGRNVTVKCSTYGYPIDQISWVKDGVLLTTSDRRKVYANGTILVVNADRSRDSGRYSCIAKNRQGQTATGERYVIVIDKPVLADIKFPDGVAEGMRVNILCNILKGEQPVTKTWLKDGNPIMSNIGIVITHTSSFSILNIEDVRRHHAGMYACTANNSAGQANKTARLIVQASPEWAVRPEDQLSAEGSTLILECLGNGYPKPTIKWSKSRYAKSVPVYESGRIEQLKNGSLIIRYARKSDQGAYTCEVANGIPPNLYQKMQLTIGLSPRVILLSAMKKVAVGNSTVLRCRVEGDPVLKVTWTYGDEEPLRSQDRLKLISEIGESEKIVELRIAKTSSADSGTYKCKATNPFGYSNSSIQLIVQEPPSPVQNISILNARNYTIQLSWHKPRYNGASEISKYIIFYESTPDGRKKVEISLKKDRINENRVKIGGMTPEVQYKLWMVAKNKIGFSSNSLSHVFRFANNGTLILSTGSSTLGKGSVMPNIMLLLVIPSVVIFFILVAVIIVVFFMLRRSRKRQEAKKRANRRSLMLEAKSADEQMYKNVGLMDELKDKQTERYGKIQSDATGRYQPLSVDYKRCSGIELYSATSDSGNYTEVSPYATSCLPDPSTSSINKKAEMKTFTSSIYYGETGVTAL